MDLEDTGWEFDEAYYLATYADVAACVAAGDYDSGWAHYMAHGRSEGRLGKPKTVHPGFDETWYLRQNPDVAEAVAGGALESGYAHFTASGKAEGRIPPPDYKEEDGFDAAWYEASYHAAREDVAAGRAADLETHYRKLGRSRGYLPNRYAPRPDDPAGIASSFGGLWPDQGNAADLIEGRLELGRITPAQADLLRRWVRDGYVVLPQALPADIVEPAAETLRRAYEGEIEGLKFECHKLGGYKPIAWDPGVKAHAAKALDLHWHSEAIQNLIFADAIRDFLELVFERRVLASQSLTFLRGSSQGYHQDTLYVPYSLPRQFIASWVALEDVAEGGGELTYYPGSHRLPDMLYAGRFKTLWDAQRTLRDGALRDEMANYSDRLSERCEQVGLSPQKFVAKKGDVLLWHADLAHGGLPISNEKTRASVVTHYCPREVASLTFERGDTKLRRYRDVASYATGHYTM